MPHASVIERVLRGCAINIIAIGRGNHSFSDDARTRRGYVGVGGGGLFDLIGERKFEQYLKVFPNARECSLTSVKHNIRHRHGPFLLSRIGHSKAECIRAPDGEINKPIGTPIHARL